MGVRGAENALLLEMRGFLSGTSVTPDDASADRPKVALHSISRRFGAADNLAFDTGSMCKSVVRLCLWSV